MDVMLTAMAADPQDGTLSGASVVWRSDLQVAPLGSGTGLTARLPVGTNVVTCTATDSSNLTGTSLPVMIVSKSPYAKINHPSSGEMRPVNQAVPFAGIGRDVEDGSLMGASLVWTSSIDGPIGTGESFSGSLTAGVHTISLTATDSANNVDSATITLTMQ